MKGLLAIENILCRCPLKLSSRSPPPVVLTMEEFSQSDPRKAPKRSPRDQFKIMASKILMQTKRKRKNIDRPARHLKYLEKQRALTGKMLHLVPTLGEGRSLVTHRSKFAKHTNPKLVSDVLVSTNRIKDITRHLNPKQPTRINRAKRSLISTKLTRHLIYYKTHADALLCPADR